MDVNQIPENTVIRIVRYDGGTYRRLYAVVKSHGIYRLLGRHRTELLDSRKVDEFVRSTFKEFKTGIEHDYGCYTPKEMRR